MNEIQNVREVLKKYGEAVFRMAISYLFQKGSDAILRSNPADVDKSIVKHHQENSILSLETERNIFFCARKLSEIPVWDLLKFIQSDIGIDDQKVTEGKFLSIQESCSGSELGLMLLPSDVDLDALDEAYKTFDKRLDNIKEYEYFDGSIDYVGLAEDALKEAGIEPKTISSDFTWIA